MRWRANSYINRIMTIGVIRILGVDPGLRSTGWGVIEAAGSRLIFVAAAQSKPTPPPRSPSAWR